MLEVFFSKNGKPFSDFTVEEAIADFIKKCDYKKNRYEINASTENVIFAIRVAILRGELDFNHVVVYTDDDQAIKFNKDGKCLNGYVDSYIEKSLDILIGMSW